MVVAGVGIGRIRIRDVVRATNIEPSVSHAKATMVDIGPVCLHRGEPVSLQRGVQTIQSDVMYAGPLMLIMFDLFVIFVFVHKLLSIFNS